MEAKNLRIGNLVYYPSENDNNEIENYICKIDGADIHQMHGNKEYLEAHKPIELTEKWMFDLGFKYQDKDVNRSDKKKERFYISPRFGQEYWFEIQLADNTPFKHSFVWFMWNIGGGNHFIHLPEGHKLKYVHELQNLFFALSGTELQAQ
jgi:hypothetical protein